MRRGSVLLLWCLLLSLFALTDAAATPPGTLPDDADHHDEEEAEAKAEFESIDTNHDGFITREEILEMEEVPEKEEIDEFFDTYDVDPKDGRVTFQEILHADHELRAAASDEGEAKEL